MRWPGSQEGRAARPQLNLMPMSLLSWSPASGEEPDCCPWEHSSPAALTQGAAGRPMSAAHSNAIPNNKPREESHEASKSQYCGSACGRYGGGAAGQISARLRCRCADTPRASYLRDGKGLAQGAAAVEGGRCVELYHRRAGQYLAHPPSSHAQG